MDITKTYKSRIINLQILYHELQKLKKFKLFPSRPDKSTFPMLCLNELRPGAFLRFMLSFPQRESSKYLINACRSIRFQT